MTEEDKKQTALQVASAEILEQSNIDKLNAHVDKIIEPFKDAQIDISDYEQVKLARKWTADLNKTKKEIEDERKRVKREWMAPLDAFEAKIKPITAKIDGAVNTLNTQVKQADANFKQERLQQLEQAYRDCAGEVADLISFEALFDKKWLNRSVTYKKAEDELMEKAAKAVADYQSILGLQLNHREDVLLRYAQTGDMGAALALEEQMNAHDAEVAAHEEQRRKMMQEQEPAPAPEPEPEPVKQAPEQPKEQQDDQDVWEISVTIRGTKEDAMLIYNQMLSIGLLPEINRIY